MTTVRIHPAVRALSGTARVPYSKPHTQRAILLSALTNAPNTIVNPAWSSEASSFFAAAQELGLVVRHSEPGRLVTTGVGRSLREPSGVLRVEGSAFNFRMLAGLACLSRHPTVIEGNRSMKTRPVLEYLGFVADLGGQIADISDADHLRVRIQGGRRVGGSTTIDTRHSSQVLTSALLISPLADRPVTIHCPEKEPVGQGYIDLTIAMMRDHGAVVVRDGGTLSVPPSAYQSKLHQVASDFTALSYLAGVVATVPGSRIAVADYQPSSLSSEAEFVKALDLLGIETTYDPVQRSLHIHRTEPVASRLDIDGSNIPTVVPTLAAIAPYVDAEVTVRNAAHVNNHKCRRIEVMIDQLTRMGCRIEPHRDASGAVDGFVSGGGQRPRGGAALRSHGDHRIFMSLATAALGAQLPSTVEGAQLLTASYPGYLDAVAGLGAEWSPAPEPLEE